VATLKAVVQVTVVIKLIVITLKSERRVVMFSLYKTSKTYILVGMAALAGCAQESELVGSDSMIAERPFLYIERDYPTMEPEAGLDFRPRLDPRDPFQFNPGAKLFMRDRVALAADTHDVLSGYFGSTDYDVKDIDVSPDGQYAIFAAHGPESHPTDNSWNIYEYAFATGQVRRLITDNDLANMADDTSPTYTYEGAVIFSSPRQASKGDFRTADDREYIEDFNEPASLLHHMKRDGSEITQITFGTYHDIEPTSMNDGHVVFIRWGREYEILTSCTEENIDNPDFGTHPNGGGHGHGNGSGGSFPPGLEGSNSWDEETKCGGSVEGENADERIFIADVFNLYRISPNGGNVHRYFGVPNEDFSDKSFIQFVDPMPAPDGNVYTIMRHIYNPNYGGDIVKVNTTRFYAEGHPIEDAEEGVAEESMSPGLVNFYPNQVSPAGWYSAVASYDDGSGRLLASWASCLTVEGERHASCEGTAVSDSLSDPRFGIWAIDPSNNTFLPVVQGRDGVFFTDIAVGVANEMAQPYQGTQIEELMTEGFGVFHIQSVYDLDGEDQSLQEGGEGILDKRDPTITAPDDRRERFIRVLTKNPVPSDLRDAILNHPEYNPTDGSGPQLHLRPLIGSGDANLYEILSYGMIEPDGSALVPAPAEQEFTFEVVNKRGKRVNYIAEPEYYYNYLSQHPLTLMLEESEVRSCHGCHEKETVNAHGRPDIPNATSNPGAPYSYAPFPNANPQIVAESAGDTMAQARAQQYGIDATDQGTLKYEDVWTDVSQHTPVASFAMDYRDLTTPAPVNDPACLDNWTAECKIVINYLEHIQPIWDACRPQIEDKSCTSCHEKADNNPHDNCAGGGGAGADLQLDGNPDPWNPGEVTSYVQLFEPKFYQINVDGEWISVENNDANCPDGVKGDLTILPDPNVCFTRRTMSARGAIASAQFFKLFDDDPDDNAYEFEETATNGNGNGGGGGGGGGNKVNHKGMLTDAELRLIAEWLDMGAHYYNDASKFEIAPIE